MSVQIANYQVLVAGCKQDAQAKSLFVRRMPATATTGLGLDLLSMMTLRQLTPTFLGYGQFYEDTRHYRFFFMKHNRFYVFYDQFQV